MSQVIKLSNGDTAIVDEEDFERVSGLRWSSHSAGYAVAHNPDQYDSEKGRSSGLVLLHRFVLGLGPGDPAVDHLNHNKLDCRRSNLNAGGQGKNMLNRAQNIRVVFSSVYRGVHHCGGKKKGRKRE